MGTDQTFNDRALLDVISLLSSRKESGRLKITDGTTRGAFFFDKGKLVDAHMGPFSGYQAVNLAVSVGNAELSFDPSVQSQTSSFKVPSERIILKERFGIETDGPQNFASQETIIKQVPLTTARAAKVSEPVVPQPKFVSEPQNEQTSAPTIPADSKAERFSSFLSLVQHRIASNSVVTKLALSLRRLISGSSHLQKTLLLASLLVFVVVTTAAGVVSYWTESPPHKTGDSVRPQTAGTSQPPVSAVSQPEEKLVEPPSTTEQAQASTRLSAASGKLHSRERDTVPLPSAESQKDALAEAEVTPEGTKVSNDEQSSSRLIRVVVEINEGHVTEAFIQKPQHGLQAYEATALRLARQRRFSKGPTRRETITVQVTGEP